VSNFFVFVVIIRCNLKATFILFVCRVMGSSLIHLVTFFFEHEDKEEGGIIVYLIKLMKINPEQRQTHA
jgi:hypothetical protein